ncbi:MAG: phage capsid protein [Peptoclostridium sp.]|uniref:major capsid protein n=1 Tax=Peptoclostridium sp. TaxID=1904860 RepID=UPI00139D8B35|nr:major capsid protein [Peptoclostridium sp.]MZQ76211.1 phage capsid protein [Peptoclostridium sp.]
MNIFDIVTAKEIASYYTALGQGQPPYLGQTLFPNSKQLGLDLSWIKGSKGLPAVLKPAAFDTKAALRDRVGFSKVETEMPFFKEGMLVKEKDRQELNKVMNSGNQSYIDMIVNKIFDDKMTLVEGAKAQAERMRMQLLSTGMIAISANGVALNYDYKMPAEHKGNAATVWSNLTESNPIADILGWMDKVEGDTGVRPVRATCTRKTWSYLLGNKAIKMDMNATSGDKIILTDSMLEQYLMAKIGLKVAINSKKFIDETGAQKNYFPDDTFTLFPEGNLGKTWFGTTPEESDLMSGTDAIVSIVETGIALTTIKHTDPVNVETKATMITLPSFERIDEVFIADVA